MATTEYLTPKEVAELLKISYDNALEFIKGSGIPYIKVGRQYRISARKLDEFLYPTKTERKTLKKKTPKLIIERGM